jgi:hypothetical protein
MNYLPIEVILLISICFLLLSVLLKDKIQKAFHPAILYFLGVALLLFSVGAYFFTEDECTYEFVGTYPIEFSQGGNINYFFDYDGNLYDAEAVVENFSSSSKKVYIYSSEEDKSSLRSVFQAERRLEFRSAEDKYILRINRDKEVRE